MSEIDPSLLLSDSEFEALSASDQEQYLKLLSDASSAWELTGRQLIADKLADEVKELLYGGAAGGGKSEWILHRAWRKSREVAGHRTLILRTSFPELRRSIIARSVVLYGTHTPAEEMPRYKSSEKEWHFPNGSVIEFGYCASEEDVAQFLSAEYDMICFDEMTQFTQSQYDLIRSRARTTVAKVRRGARPHVIGATNPGQRGHGHAKAIFVDPTNRGADSPVWLVRDGDSWRRPFDDEIFDEKKARRIAFVPSTVADNPHIDPEYIANLQTMPEKLRRRYLEGDWDNPEGMFFDEFNRKRTLPTGEEIAWHVIEPFEIPSSWHKIRASDYGFAAPFCTLWMAWDHDGRCYVYREAYRARLTPREQAKLVSDMQRSTEKIAKSVADPAAWANKEGISVARQWADNGFRNTKAINDRVSGWARVREYLKPSDADQIPMVQIFSTCENLIRTLPEMIHDDHKPEDLDTDLEDHAVDALRYGLMTRPLRPIKQPSTMDRAAKHFDRITRRKKKNTHDILGRMP